MIRVRVEAQLVGRTCRPLAPIERALQFAVHITDHVGVTVDNHVILIFLRNVHIVVTLALKIRRLQFDVVVITFHLKSAFEQRLVPISLHVDTSPAHGVPSPRSCSSQRSPFKNLVVVSLNGFFPMHIPIFVQVLYVGVISENIMVRFQFEFYPMTAVMETEGKIIVGQVVDFMRRGLNHGVVQDGNISDGTGGLRSGWD